MRRADLKVMMELVLEEMGKLLDDGDEVVLPPLGKLAVKKKRVERPGGDMLTIKLKRLTPEAHRGLRRAPRSLRAPGRGMRAEAPCEARTASLNRAHPAGD